VPGAGSQDGHEWSRVLAAEILVCRSRGLRVTFPAKRLPANARKRAAIVALLETLGVELAEEPV
jgi:hypothetical protein